MKAEYEYSVAEVLAIVLAQHEAACPPPRGMRWTSRFAAYGSQCVSIEAVEKETEGGAA